MGPNFSFAMGWVGLGQSFGGLGWARSKKMDPRTTLRLYDDLYTYYDVIYIYIYIYYCINISMI